MRKFLWLFLLLPLYCNAQNKADEDRIYEFLDQFFEHIPTYLKYHTDKEHAYFESSADLRPINESLFRTNAAFDINHKPSLSFSCTDSVTIVKELNRYRRTGFKFDPNKLTYRKFLSDSVTQGGAVKDSSWLWYQIHRNGMSINSISVPIFFDKGRQAIFYYGGSGGLLAGDWYVALFRKIKGRWVQLSVLYEWVS